MALTLQNKHDLNCQITVVLVNWNTKELLRECLEAVHASLDEPSVIVVDNGSTDGSLNLVKNSFPEVRIITNNENLGFATANNQAIKVARSEYTLFLNTDAVVNKHTVDRLIEFMDSHPEAGLCTGTLVRANGTIQDTFGPYPSLITEILGRSILRLFSSYRYTPSRCNIGTEPRRVQAIRGACMLARRSAIESVGGFDERYFLFLEEADLCLRLNKRGYQIWWLPEVKVYHKGGGSADTKAPSARIEYWRSRYIFFYKHYSAWKCNILRFGLFIKLVIDWVLNLIGSIAKPFRRKLKSYSTIILWHILGCPGDWGLSSGNTVKIDNGFLRKGFESWWKENSKKILEAKDIIKDSTVRSLMNYKGEAYVKRYKGRHFGKSPWLEEWRLISRVRQLGISTVIPIAVGKRYLVTQRLRDVENLHNFVLENVEKLTFQEKLDLTRSFAMFINKLHRKGIYHGDLHAGNILIKCDPMSIGSHFYLTDFHRARLKMHLSKRRILRNMVQLNVFFALQTSSALRMRFFKYYISDTPLFRDYKHYARIIEIHTKRACQKLWNKRDRLYLKKRKYGISGIYKGMGYIINPKYAHLVPSPFPLPGGERGRVRGRLDLGGTLPYLKPGSSGISLKDSRSSYLCLLELPDLGKVILKIHRQKRFINYIKDIWRNSRAFRAWCGSWALLTRGIPTPEPILAIERRRLRILRESLIVNRNIDSTENLTIWIYKNWEERTLAFKKYFIDRLAGYIRRIHNRGVSPRDLKASNILVQEDGDEVKFYLIDLDHLGRSSRVSLNKRLYNITQLNKSFPNSSSISATMRWRFLRGYFPKKDIDERKRVVKKIYKRISS